MTDEIEFTEVGIEYTPADIPSLEKHLKDVHSELDDIAMKIRIYESGIGG